MKLDKVLVEKTNVQVISILVAIAGIINVISAVFPALEIRFLFLSHYLPLEVLNGARLITVLAGFALIMLALNLWRHKLVAFVLTIAVLLISAASHVFKGLDFEEASFLIILAIWLFSVKRYFRAEPDFPSINQGFITLAIVYIFILNYVFFGFFILRQEFFPIFSPGPAIKNTLLILIFQSPRIETLTPFAKYFIDSVFLVYSTLLFYALGKIFSPILIRKGVSSADRKKAQRISQEYGKTSLSFFALFPDKIYFLIGQSMISYTLKEGVALVLGDPIGPKGERQKIIEGFAEVCQKNGWMPAFYQTSAENMILYRQLGLSELEIGQEAIVDLTDFSLTGSENKRLRNSVNHIEKKKFRFEAWAPPLRNNQIEILRNISDEWLSASGRDENKFSLGWFDESYLKNCRVFIVRNEKNQPIAFVNIFQYDQDKIGIDLMRRRKLVENGTMEFLFVRLFNWAKAKGYRSCDLGLSPLAAADNKAITGRAIRFIFTNLNQFYNFKGLYLFKKQFHPKWESRFLVYPKRANLLRLALAIVRAHAFELPFLPVSKGSDFTKP